MISNQLLQCGQSQDKTRVGSVTEKITGWQFLFVLSFVFLNIFGCFSDSVLFDSTGTIHQCGTTSDAGGGQNLGYIGDGNWAEYAIENNSPNSEYQISFRLASPNTGGMINFYLDDISMGSVSVPNIGNWQVYQSVVSNINISQGKHYLKAVATKAGFNFNYMDIQAVKLGVNKVTTAAADVYIYPNPVSNELIINSADFQFDKIEIFDSLCRLIMSKTATKEPILCIPDSFIQ
ncbi:MAG TPA: carbohydrate-binding protein [Flavobacterium sp.]